VNKSTTFHRTRKLASRQCYLSAADYSTRAALQAAFLLLEYSALETFQVSFGILLGTNQQAFD